MIVEKYILYVFDSKKDKYIKTVERSSLDAIYSILDKVKKETEKPYYMRGHWLSKYNFNIASMQLDNYKIRYIKKKINEYILENRIIGD